MNASSQARRSELVHLRCEEIEVDHEWNSRDALTSSSIADAGLEDDIRRRGLIQPMVVTKNGERWLLVAGSRRHRACNAVDSERQWPCLLRSFEDFELEVEQETAGANLAENIQRRNLRPFEVANAVHRIHKRWPELTLAQLSELSGLGQGYTRQLLNIRTRACPDVWEVFVRYGKRYPQGLRFEDLLDVTRLPRLEQLDAWKKIVAERAKTRPARKKSKKQKRTLEGYLGQVDELNASADFRGGVRFGLRVALNREPWPEEKKS